MADPVKMCIQCGRIACLGTGPACRRGPPRSPFPPEVVERAQEAYDATFNRHAGPVFSETLAQLHTRAINAALSVIADYLRSEEARERVARHLARHWAKKVPWVALMPAAKRLLMQNADAVIAALLGSGSR